MLFFLEVGMSGLPALQPSRMCMQSTCPPAPAAIMAVTPVTSGASGRAPPVKRALTALPCPAAAAASKGLESCVRQAMCGQFVNLSAMARGRCWDCFVLLLQLGSNGPPPFVSDCWGNKMFVRLPCLHTLWSIRHICTMYKSYFVIYAINMMQT